MNMILNDHCDYIPGDVPIRDASLATAQTESHTQSWATAIAAEVRLVARPPVNVVVRDPSIFIDGRLCKAEGCGAGEDEGINA
jgi:hypothetical protein